MKLKHRRKKVKVEKASDYSELSELLSSHVRYFSDIINASCLNCSRVQERMIRVFAYTFCVDCFLNNFDFRSKSIDKDQLEKWRKKHMSMLEKKGLFGRKAKQGGLFDE